MMILIILFSPYIPNTAETFAEWSKAQDFKSKEKTEHILDNRNTFNCRNLALLSVKKLELRKLPLKTRN
jgi:hypothetical protein